MTRGTLRVYLGTAPGVGKTVAMLDEGRRRRDRGTDVVVGFVETHDRPHTVAMLDGLEVQPRRFGRLPRGDLHRTRPGRADPASARARVGGRTRPHQCPWSREREALAGRSRAAGRRHQRDHDRQCAAPGLPQRRGRKDHRRAPARAGARRGGSRRGSSRTHRHDPGGLETANGARQHLRAGEGRRRAGQLLPRRESHRTARVRAALAGRRRR